jgi:hypothetical protein
MGKGKLVVEFDADEVVCGMSVKSDEDESCPFQGGGIVEQSNMVSYLDLLVPKLVRPEDDLDMVCKPCGRPTVSKLERPGNRLELREEDSFDNLSVFEECTVSPL